MDTDYLTKKAYDVLIRESDKISEFLCCDIGSMAKKYSDEKSYMAGVFDFLQEIADDPLDYLESWNLEDDTDCELFLQKIKKLIEKVEKVAACPASKRGGIPRY